MPKSKKNKETTSFDIDEEYIIGYTNEKVKKKSPKKKKKKLTKDNEQEEVNKKVKKKKKKVKKKKNKLKKVLKLLLKFLIIIAIIVGTILFLFVSPVFNIQEIAVFGAKEIGENAYIAMSEFNIGQNIFSINKAEATARIKEEVYVESVEINIVYPNKIEINIKERQTSYIAECNGKYFSIDKNGYILEINLSPLDYLNIKGYTTNLKTKQIGDRIDEQDLSKFNDLIKIVDALQNNDISAKLTSVDISDSNNYKLEFPDEKKNVMLGDSSDLSAKMSWINFFIKEKKNENITIHLNVKNVYFSPNS